MSTFAVFLSFSFLFLIHDKLFLYTHWNSLSLHHMIKPYLHSKIFSVFLQHTPMAHTKVSLYTLIAHTHKNFFPRIIYTQRPFIHIFLLHTCIDKNLFLFFMNMTFIHNASFFFIMILVYFIFKTTFLNEKFFAILEFQQTLLTTTKQVLT